MNESGPENPEQKVSSYEGKVRKGYDELGKEGLGVESWGTMIMPWGARFNGYTDEKYIDHTFTEPISRVIGDRKDQVMVADLGGDDGFLLDEVLVGLKDTNPDAKVKGLVVDIDSTGKARQKFSEKQAAGERQNIEYVVADITKLPFGDGTLDSIISRMSMQYLDQEQQDQFLKEISRVLKKNGVCLVETITSETDHEAFNQIWGKITEIISKSTDFKRVFPSFGSFSRQPFVVNEYGLITERASRIITFPFSVSAFIERFNIDRSELDELFATESKKSPDLFETIDGQLCLMARLLDIRFKKA
jgi:SAM-dependent methyltransferase